jgi:hypothetical protein
MYTTPILSARALGWALPFLAAVAFSGCGGSDAPQATTSTSANRMTALSASAPSNVTVVGLIKISETRVSRTIYDYVFKITVKNDAVARTAIMATATGAGQGTTILDGSVLVGDMAAGAVVTSSDTITVRHDRSLPFNITALIWQVTEPINGIAVPPEPDPVSNDSSVAGIDSNRNGIRDDVERLLATKFGTDGQKYTEAFRISKAEQALLVTPSSALRAELVRLIECETLPASDLDIPTLRLLNTSDRKYRLAGAMAGALIGRCK